MRKMVLTLFALVFTLAATQFSFADNHDTSGYAIRKIPASFEDVFNELQDVIINKGLVIDLVGDVGTMIERTAEVAKSITEEGSKSPYIAAKYVLFCSAKLTQKAVSASSENMGICPYIVFVYETKAEPGMTHIGYRQPILGPSRRSKKISMEIIAFLQSILDETESAGY